MEEANIISDVFCRKRRKPLLIGSVKSNVGHAEAAACAVGAVKAIIALKNTKIPPNININSPLPELTSRGIKVILYSLSHIGFLNYHEHVAGRIRRGSALPSKGGEWCPSEKI